MRRVLCAIALAIPVVVFTQVPADSVSPRAKQLHELAIVVDSHDDTTQRLIFDKAFDIGKRNYLALRKILWKAGILLAGEAVGGGTSRTVRLEIGSGRLWLQVGGGQKELVPSFPQKGGNIWRTGS